MLLLEIIQVDQTEKNIDVHDENAYKKQYRTDLTTRRGRDIGAFAKYDRIRNEPKMGVKQSLRPLPEQDDAYYTYIKTISQNDTMSSNPYFPRVYGINTTKDNHGKIIYKINMEHLKNLKDIPKDDLISLLSRMFDGTILNKYHIISSNNDNRIFYDRIGQIIRDVAYGKVQTIDDNLRNALKLIQKIRNEHNYANDINKNNIMIRRTNLGYQLVITDPLS